MKERTMLFGLAVLFARMSPMFGGEDPLASAGSGKWHHEELTKAAAHAAGWQAEAAEELAFAADYLDSYLYNPLWWIRGGVTRLKASLSTRDELKDLHFDDLTSTARIDTMWRRYTSGAVAGLLWASEQGPGGNVAAARNVVGASLHAIQDFYSHSNWIDDPARRGRTWLDHTGDERRRIPLFTGTYEGDELQGVKHHGAISFACTLLRQLPPWVMGAVCHAFSPMSGTALCQEWTQCGRGVVAQPPTVAGVRTPANVLYLAPPGIALDSTWQAPVAVDERGLTDIDAQTAFDTALDLARRDSTAWLTRLDDIMRRAGKSPFWDRVKSAGDSGSKERQFEDFDSFPYMFLTVGPYPPGADESENDWFLRLRLKTADESGAGTDSDIYAIANGRRRLLDYMPREIPGLGHNDFVAGDDEVYFLGPFQTLPATLQLFNDAPSFGDVLTEIGRAFVGALETALDAVGDLLLSLISGHADIVASNRQLWSPPLLKTSVQPNWKQFTITLDGDSEGNYRVVGSIRRARQVTERGRSFSDYEVRLDTLICDKESEWDRGSAADEPFLLTLLINQASNALQKWRSQAFSDVDTDETVALNHTYATERVPDDVGYLTLAIKIMESDDESAGARNRLLDEFATRLDRDTAATRRGLINTLGAAMGPDWKLSAIEVYAFQRGRTVTAGTALRAQPDRWIRGGEQANFALRLAAPTLIATNLNVKNQPTVTRAPRTTLPPITEPVRRMPPNP
jgi:hypothetical protein